MKSTSRDFKGFSDGEPQPETSANQEITIIIAFLDKAGREQFMSVRSTLAAQELAGQAAEIKTAVQAYCKPLGYTLLAIQVTFESSEVIVGARPRPALSLVLGGKA